MTELLNAPITTEELTATDVSETYERSDVLKASEVTPKQAHDFGDVAIKDAIDQLLTKPTPHETTPNYNYKDNY